MKRHRPRLRSRGWIAFLVVLSGLLLVASSAIATVVRHFELHELVEISDVVAVGRVVDQTMQPDDDHPNRVITLSTLEVEAALKGEVPKQITIRQWGGEVGERITVIPGDAELERGEEVLVFLDRDRRGLPLYYFTAMKQSKWTIEYDSDGNRVARRNLDGLGVLVESENGATIEHLEELSLSLEALIDEIEMIVNAQEGR